MTTEKKKQPRSAVHKYKGGRVRPEKAETTGLTPRGVCVACGRFKKSHF